MRLVPGSRLLLVLMFCAVTGAAGDAQMYLNGHHEDKTKCAPSIETAWVTVFYMVVRIWKAVRKATKKRSRTCQILMW